MTWTKKSQNLKTTEMGCNHDSFRQAPRECLRATRRYLFLGTSLRIVRLRIWFFRRRLVLVARFAYLQEAIDYAVWCSTEYTFALSRIVPSAPYFRLLATNGGSIVSTHSRGRHTPPYACLVSRIVPYQRLRTCPYVPTKKHSTHAYP